MSKKNTGKKAKTQKRIKVTGDEPQVAAPAAPEATATTPTAPKTRKKPERKDGTMSGLDAAAKVLAEAKEPLDCRAIAERAIAQGLWKSGGATPHATLYSAMLREWKKKGDASRFRRVEKGKFAIVS